MQLSEIENFRLLHKAGLILEPHTTVVVGHNIALNNGTSSKSVASPGE
jgi:hypothetical protein